MQSAAQPPLPSPQGGGRWVPRRTAATHAHGEGWGEGAGDNNFPIWPDNIATLELFLACRTQWKMLAGATSLVRLGLDYAAVQTVMRLHGVKNKDAPQVFNELQHMEVAALQEWL